MATRKKAATAPKVRASISEKRQLALALRAMLDAVEDSGSVQFTEDVHKSAIETLNVLGFGSLIGIPKQIAALEAQLATAVTAHDYPAIARLGQQLERVKLGKSPTKVVPTVKAKSSRKNEQSPTPDNVTKIVNEESVIGGEPIGTI